ncbi:hypothetical protein [Marinicella gelatinilytica]|uniref:hypothetical protein n=1 Tax=Marinicella gelatinilytica TaxID=2996017 RepID=UPI002260D327|nr:hypothetical protein [Marinicella gelatinilytica]MCX7544162.1 hypothetical protein [Marinicella gelatinilytica]
MRRISFVGQSLNDIKQFPENAKREAGYQLDMVQKGVFLGLHSLLFPTKVKAAAANTSYNFALFASDSLRSPTGSAGRAAQQHSEA